MIGGGTANLSIIISAIDRASGTFSKVGNKLAATGAKMKSVGKGMTMALTLPIVGIGVASIKSAKDFEDTANKVGATANLTKEQVEKLAKGVEKVATETGQATDGIFAAMQKAVSGSLDLAESQELVAKTSKAAAAGFGENEKLVDVVTTAYDLFGDSAGSAGDILDTLVRSAQATQVTAQDMADAFSRGAPTASNLGISAKELSAMLGVVSERMGDTQRGGRALAMMLREIQKPTGESKDVIEELYGSVDKFQEGIRKDAIGALKELKIKLEGTEYGIEDVITSSNALDAANLLLSDSGERVSEVLGEVENSAGAVDDAYEKSASNAREMAKAKEKLAAALRPLGKILMEMITPAITKLSDALKKAGEWFSNLSPATKKIVVVIALLVAALGPVLMILGSILPALPMIGTAFTALISPIGLVIAVIGLLVGVFIYAWKNWAEICEGFKFVTQALGDKIYSIFEAIKNFFIRIWESIKNIFKAAWEFVKAIFFNATVPGLIIKNWEAIRVFFSNIWEGIKGIFKTAWEFIKMIFFNATIPGLIIKNWGKISPFFSGIWEGIKNIFGNAIDWIKDKIDGLMGLVEKVKKVPAVIKEKVSSGFSSFGNKIDEVGASAGSWLKQKLHFNKGGVVPGVGPQLAVVHGGETIIPQGEIITPSGGATGNINIYIQGGNYLDREAGEKFAEILGKMLRRELRY